MLDSEPKHFANEKPMKDNGEIKIDETLDEILAKSFFI